jgi:hypothetical protein
MISTLKNTTKIPNSDETSDIETQRLRIVFADFGVSVAETLLPSAQKFWQRDLNLVFNRNGREEKPAPPPCHIHPEDGAAIEADMRKALQSADGRFEIALRIVEPPRGTRVMRMVGRISAETSGQTRLVAALLAVDDSQTKPPAAAPHPNHIIGARLRAARGLLNWSVRELAQIANVSESTIRRMEDAHAADSVGPATRRAVRQSLERAGLRFVAVGQRIVLSSHPGET